MIGRTMQILSYHYFIVTTGTYYRDGWEQITFELWFCIKACDQLGDEIKFPFDEKRDSKFVSCVYTDT